MTKLLPKIGKRRAKSKFEVTVFNWLKSALPRKATLAYEADVLPYTTEHNYTPDFTIDLNGKTIYIESKGLGKSFDALNRAKLIAVRNQHPDKDIRLVFMRDGRLSRNTKFKASDWATKHGFLFSVGTIPKEWFNV